MPVLYPYNMSACILDAKIWEMGNHTHNNVIIIFALMLCAFTIKLLMAPKSAY